MKLALAAEAPDASAVDQTRGGDAGVHIMRSCATAVPRRGSHPEFDDHSRHPGPSPLALLTDRGPAELERPWHCREC